MLQRFNFLYGFSLTFCIVFVYASKKIKYFKIIVGIYPSIISKIHVDVWNYFILYLNLFKLKKKNLFQGENFDSPSMPQYCLYQ